MSSTRDVIGAAPTGKLADAISLCKGPAGHAWYESTTDRVPLFGTYLAWRCERCTTERLDKVNHYGELLGRIYHHPEGYKYLTADSKAAWRAEYIAKLARRGTLRWGEAVEPRLAQMA